MLRFFFFCGGGGGGGGGFTRAQYIDIMHELDSTRQKFGV